MNKDFLTEMYILFGNYINRMKSRTDKNLLCELEGKMNDLYHELYNEKTGRLKADDK